MLENCGFVSSNLGAKNAYTGNQQAEIQILNELKKLNQQMEANNKLTKSMLDKLESIGFHTAMRR